MSASNEIATRSSESLVEQALDTTLRAGADSADIVLVRGRSLEARVRDKTVEFVKQAQEQVLGIRVLMQGEGGMKTAVTSTSDLASPAIEQMARETVALARATEADPAAGLPEDGFATNLPDLSLVEPSDRDTQVDVRIDDARAAERAARAYDERITNSVGSQVRRPQAFTFKRARQVSFQGEHGINVQKKRGGGRSSIK